MTSEETPVSIKVGSKKPESKRGEYPKATKILKEDNKNPVGD